MGIGHPTPYSNQIEIVRELLQNPTGTPDEEVVEQLGHSQMAVYSVPTAIYCFLRAQSEIENVEVNSREVCCECNACNYDNTCYRLQTRSGEPCNTLYR